MTPWDRLLDRLRKAQEAFTGNGRTGAGKSLGAIIDYLDDMGMPADLRAPLFALLAALQDLENGKQSPMLKAPNLPHGPPEAIVSQVAKAQAAAAMQLLMAAGDGRETAARAVARADKWGGENNATWRQVARWRDELRAGLKSDLASANFDTLARDYKAAGRDPRRDAQALLTGCVWAPERIPEDPPA